MKLEEIRKLIDDAQAEVSALCKGKQWRMCIPYQRDDSDALIGGALRKASKLLAVVAAARLVAACRNCACEPDKPGSIECTICGLNRAIDVLEADE